MDLNQLVNRVTELELIVKKKDYRAFKALADAAVTLGVGDLVDGGLFTITPTAARILTTPTAALIQAGMVPRPVVGDSFMVHIRNLAAHNVTLTAGTNVSVNEGIINNTWGTWIFIMTAATIFEVYRVG